MSLEDDLEQAVWDARAQAWDFKRFIREAKEHWIADILVEKDTLERQAAAVLAEALVDPKPRNPGLLAEPVRLLGEPVRDPTRMD